MNQLVFWLLLIAIVVIGAAIVLALLNVAAALTATIDESDHNE